VPETRSHFADVLFAYRLTRSADLPRNHGHVI